MKVEQTDGASQQEGQRKTREAEGEHGHFTDRKTDTVSPDGEGRVQGHTASQLGAVLEDQSGSADSSAPQGGPYPTPRGEYRPASWSTGCSLVPPHPGALAAAGTPDTKQDQPTWGLGQDLIFPFLLLAGSARTMLSQRIATSCFETGYPLPHPHVLS